MGGMAEIFLARSTSMHGFEKTVVLKRMLPQFAENEDFISMFLNEARLAATLAHPNIAQVYDIGEHDGHCFFTMEYVSGQNLRNVARAATASIGLPLEHVVNIVIGVAAGLHYAHEQVDRVGRPLGLVHRDVSPTNIIATYDGGVKLVDFGIAKASTAQVATAVGTLKGKIPYMSPGQCRGAPLDRRSDIFSLGTVLWELTTGSRLFRGDNEFGILNRISKGEIPQPSSRRSNYPEDLEAIVMRALEGDREHRYETAQELQIALEDYAREHKLSISSAKLAQFMARLFEEEIERHKQLLAKLAEEDVFVKTHRLEAEDVEILQEEILEIEPDEISAYTPSEVYAQASATAPGRDAEGTSISRLSRFSSVVRQSPARAKIGALGIGLAVVVGGLLALSLAGDDSEGTDAKDAASATASQTPSVIIVPRTEAPPPPPPPPPEETKTEPPPEVEEKPAEPEKKKRKRRPPKKKPKPSGAKTATIGVAGPPGRAPPVVYIDGKRIGRTPIAPGKIKVSAGRHSVKCVWPDGVTFQKSVKVSASGRKIVKCLR
jgi:serine/threonine-protein kinase